MNPPTTEQREALSRLRALIFERRIKKFMDEQGDLETSTKQDEKEAGHER